MIPWGPFRPDTGGPNSGMAATADNVLPQSAPVAGGIGYGPFAQFTTLAGAGALSGAPRGAISLALKSGAWNVFFATSSTIEQLASNYTFSSIETGRSVTSGDDVSFCKFDDYLLNSDTTDGFKAYNVETPAGNNAVSGAPTARFIFTCNNVVFGLDCDGNNRRVQSSKLGDHTDWITGGANRIDLPDGGALVAGCDLKNGYGLIFQESAMRLINFNEAPDGALYSLKKAADGRGSVGARSVISFDGTVYYLASDGFYRFDLANGNQPIGAEKVNRWFLSQISTANLSLVQGVIDPENKVILWRFPSVLTGSTLIFDRVLGYDWQLNEFFTLTVNTTFFARIQTPALTLDAMDSLGVLDTITQPLDDRFFQGGQPLFGGLDSNYKFATFSGSPMAATLQSATINNPVSGMVGRCTPISDAPNSTIQLGVTDSLATALTWKTAASRSRAGAVPLRGRGLNIAFKEAIPAGETWTYSNGVDHVRASQDGPR